MMIDWSIIVLYAVGMIAIGWYSARKVKSREGYLVAGRSLGIPMYIGTVATTVIGGGITIGSMGLGYRFGISAFWMCASFGVGIMVLNLFIAKHLLKLKIYTISNILERRYNLLTRKVSACIMFANTTIVGVISIVGIGTILKVLLGIEMWQGVLLGGGVIILYSVVGGMWSITLTDIVQFSIQTVGIIFILLPISLYKAGGWSGLSAQLPEAHFSLVGLGFPLILTYFIIFGLGMLIGQDIWQRTFTARNQKVAQIGGFLAGVYCLFYGLACALIGMSAKAIIPDIANSNDVFATMLQNELGVGIRGIVLAAVLSAAMSTSSAGIIASSTIITEDLFPNIAMKEGRNNLSINRIMTLLIGILVIGISLFFDNVLDAMSLAYNLLVGGMLIPILGAIYWKKSTAMGATISMIIGLATVVLLVAIDGFEATSPIYYGLLTGFISFVVISLLTFDSSKMTPTIVSLVGDK